MSDVNQAITIPNTVHEVDGDLLAITRFKNNLLHQLVPPGTASSVAKQIGISPSILGQFLNLKLSPFVLDGGGKYRRAAHAVADHFQVDIERLFPRDLYALKLPNLVERAFHSDQIIPMLEARQQNLLSPSENTAIAKIEKSETRKVLWKAMKETLTTKEQLVVTLLFGLDGLGERTTEEISARLGVSGTRIDQIKRRALRKLRHPAWKELLGPVTPPDSREFLYEETPFGEISLDEANRLTIENNPANLPQALRYITIQRQKEKEQNYQLDRYDKLVKEQPDLEPPEMSRAVISLNKVMNLTLEEANFSTRLHNCLLCTRIEKIGDLFERDVWQDGDETKFSFRWTEKSLRKIRHLGKTGLEELDAFYVTHGLCMPPGGIHSAPKK